MTLYKVLGPDGVVYHGGAGKWHLPRGQRPGKWMPPLDALVPCQRGYHLCRAQDLVYWLGPVIWEAEARGERIECEDKVVVAQARLVRLTRWDERIARLFAADCAEHVLPLFEARYPDDQRPRQAREVARRYARGEATMEEMSAAAYAYAAAYAAEREWQTARLMAYLRGEDSLR